MQPLLASTPDPALILGGLMAFSALGGALVGGLLGYWLGTGAERRRWEVDDAETAEIAVADSAAGRRTRVDG